MERITHLYHFVDKYVNTYSFVRGGDRASTWTLTVL